MTGSPDEESIKHVENLIVNSHENIGEKESIGFQLPQIEEVIFTESKIKILDQEIEIPYSSIRDFRSFKDWDGSKYKSGILKNKYEATRTRYWRMILENRAYFTLSKSNTEVEKALRAGAVDVSVSNISKQIADKITSTVLKNEDRSVTYVPVEYLGFDGELRVEGWKGSASEINAGIDAGATTGGVSLGLESGPFSVGGSASKSSISGEIEGEISDNTYSTPIESFLIFEDKIIIDSELTLELFYEEIDRVTAMDRGLVIEVGKTTYRTKIRNCKDQLDEIQSYISNQIDGSANKQKEADSSTDIADKLRQLKDLHEDGVVSDEEFEAKKSELLNDF